jgi:hypothetical protein
VVPVVVTRAPSLVNGERFAVTAHPDLDLVDGEPLSRRDLDRPGHWLRRNGGVVARYWRQELMFTKEFRERLVCVEI